MFLKNIHVVPGKIVEVVDTIGTIKAVSFDLFSVDEDPELLPPIYPFVEANSCTFSSPLVDDEIWIVFDESNPQLLYYLRRKQIPTHMQSLLDAGDENLEIIMSRETDDALYQIFFSDGTGLKLLKDESYICINSDDSITLATSSSNRTISISPSSISLGTEGGSAEPALLGEQTKTALTQIHALFQAISAAAKPNPFTSAIAAAIDPLEPLLSAQIDKVQSVNVTLD